MKMAPLLLSAVHTGWTGADITPHIVNARGVGMAVIRLGGANSSNSDTYTHNPYILGRLPMGNRGADLGLIYLLVF